MHCRWGQGVPAWCTDLIECIIMITSYAGYAAFIITLSGFALLSLIDWLQFCNAKDFCESPACRVLL